MILVARLWDLTCPLCPGETFSSITPQAWAEGHTLYHAATAIVELEYELKAAGTCARCKRVPLDGPLPHRPCFEATCVCSCSYVREGVE